MSKNGKVRCYCSLCKQLTWHDILAKASTSSDDDGFWWNIDYYLVKCCGCDEYTFLTESKDESDVEYDEYGNMTLNTKQKTYPIQQPIAEKLPDLWHILPSKLNKIYNETLDTLNNHCYLLAAAGFRVIVEAICTEENIEGKSLETKINNLCKKGVITRNDRDRLHTIRFMGNDSVHSVKEPTKDQLLLVLEIIHNMLNNLYVLARKSSDILENPIRTFSDFAELIDMGLKNRQVGDIDVLKNLLPPTRRLIQEDKGKFETELCEKIKAGEYLKLGLCPQPEAGKNQQYKIKCL